jgi:hypothetical protein
MTLFGGQEASTVLVIYRTNYFFLTLSDTKFRKRHVTSRSYRVLLYLSTRGKSWGTRLQIAELHKITLHIVKVPLLFFGG